MRSSPRCLVACVFVSSLGVQPAVAAAPAMQMAAGPEPSPIPVATAEPVLMYLRETLVTRTVAADNGDPEQRLVKELIQEPHVSQFDPKTVTLTAILLHYYPRCVGNGV